MRIAVLADIHGNLRALEAVRQDLARRSPDLIVNLGDHVSGPLQAAATADLLMQQDWVHIRGNHDRQLLDRSPASMGLSDQAAHAQLTPRHLEWLAGLPPTQSLPPTQILTEGVLLCHGTPASDVEYLLEEVHGDCVGLASPEQIRAKIGNVSSELIFCGHSHVPRVLSVLGGIWVVNPGSVGLPGYEASAPAPHYVETGSPLAKYAVVDWSGKKLRVDLIALDYDWASASREAAEANRPDWAHALATGYVLRPRGG
jgi:predicted phosphodiesterase